MKGEKIMNDEIIKNVTDVTGEAIETAKDVTQADEVNPWMAIGAFVGGIIAGAAGIKVYNGIKGLIDKKKSEKNVEGDEEPTEEDGTEDKKDNKDKNKK